ncbi:MAG TPA: carbon-nitrogen hydrolase family protein [Solirubrobacterales bacterium]|nr:carbon-nitrogen hydrolase family protein [Solirubrobacterales bacterium]
MSRTVRLAAVQPALELGAVEENLAHVEELIRDAHREHSPEVITVPESMTTPNVYSPLMADAARPVDGQPFQLLGRLARELDCVIGGGFIATRGTHTYGTYVLAEPDGSANLHDKDIPTAWEHNYYRGGDDDGVIDSGLLGRIGLACGWEWARNQTAARLRAGRVRLLLGGMCWPSFPTNWPGPLELICRRERAVQRQLARELPRQVARMIGAPVSMPSHVGDVAFDAPMMPGVPWKTEMVGETQIVERDGTILARLAYEDGAGHIGAEVELRDPEPLDPIPDRFWIPVMPASIHAVWHPLNLHGAARYRLGRARRRHPWQQQPPVDLPDRIPPHRPAEQPAAVE